MMVNGIDDEFIGNTTNSEGDDSKVVAINNKVAINNDDGEKRCHGTTMMTTTTITTTSNSRSNNPRRVKSCDATLTTSASCTTDVAADSNNNKEQQPFLYHQRYYNENKVSYLEARLLQDQIKSKNQRSNNNDYQEEIDVAALEELKLKIQEKISIMNNNNGESDNDKSILLQRYCKKISCIQARSQQQQQVKCKNHNTRSDDSMDTRNAEKKSVESPVELELKQNETSVDDTNIMDDYDDNDDCCSNEKNEQKKALSNIIDIHNDNSHVDDMFESLLQNNTGNTAALLELMLQDDDLARSNTNTRSHKASSRGGGDDGGKKRQKEYNSTKSNDESESMGSDNKNKNCSCDDQCYYCYHRNTITVFQASPLVYIDAKSNKVYPLSLPNFEYEKQVLTDTLLPYNNNSNNQEDNDHQDLDDIGAVYNTDDPSRMTKKDISIDLNFDIATVDRLSSYFLDESSSSCNGIEQQENRRDKDKTMTIKNHNVLHLSMHGHPDYLAVEDNGSGIMQPLLVEQLREFVSAAAAVSSSTSASLILEEASSSRKRSGNTNNKKKKKKQNNYPNKNENDHPTTTSLVFVSACYSKSAGQAFIDAGVTKHVVCCHQNEQLHDAVAIEFAKNLYRALASGKTLKQAFILAKKTPSSYYCNSNNNKEEMDKYILLPEKPLDDPYHDVHIFLPNNNGCCPTNHHNNKVIATIPKRRRSTFNNQMYLPPLPQPPKLMIGRELMMYKVISELHNTKSTSSRLIQITGPSGIGKTSLIRSVVYYIRSRKRQGPSGHQASNSSDHHIAWIPSQFVGVIDYGNDDDDSGSVTNQNSNHDGRCPSFSSSLSGEISNVDSSHHVYNNEINNRASCGNTREQSTLILLLRHFQDIIDNEINDQVHQENINSDVITSDGSETTASTSLCTSISSSTTGSRQKNQNSRSLFRTNSGSIIDTLYNMNIVIIIDANSIEYPTMHATSEHRMIKRLVSFVRGIIEHTLFVKVVLICPSSYQPSSSSLSSVSRNNNNDVTIDESTIINVPPLSIRSSAMLFGNLCPHVTNRRCQYIHSSTDLVNLLILPEYDYYDHDDENDEETVRGGHIEINKSNNNGGKKSYRTKRFNDIYRILGNGIPERIRNKALTMSIEEYDELIWTGERKDCLHTIQNISTRVELEKEICLLSQQINEATKNTNFELAKELNDTREELIHLRTNRPSLTELVRLQTRLNKDIQTAIQGNQYALANNKQRELVSVKNQIEKEVSANPKIDHRHAINSKIHQDNDEKEEPNPLSTDHGNREQSPMEVDDLSSCGHGGIIDIESLANDLCTIVNDRLCHCISKNDDRNKIFPETSSNNGETKKDEERDNHWHHRKWLCFVVLLILSLVGSIAAPTAVKTSKQNKIKTTDAPSSSPRPSVKPTSTPTLSKYPTLQPSLKPSLSPTISFDMTVVIQLDGNPSETSWRLDCGLQSTDRRNLFNVPVGTYKGRNDIVYQYFEAGEGEICQLVLSDAGGDGITDGYCKVFEGIVSRERYPKAFGN